MEKGGDHLPDYKDELAKQLSLMSLYHNDSDESLNAGESSSSLYPTPGHIYDHLPIWRYTFQPELLSYPPNAQYRTPATNPNFASTSSPLYNDFLLNQHNPNEILPQRTYGNTEPQDSQIDQSILDMISDPILLYECACSWPGFIEELIIILRDFQTVILCLVKSLSEVLVELACNPKGKRVIMKCFVNLGLLHRSVLANKTVQHCLDLATDKYGCIFLNQCMPLMEETYKEDILSTICNHALFLAQHCYGTYVVQDAIMKQYPHFTLMIVMKVRHMFPLLSTQKQGSHFVQKCIESCLTTREIAVDALVEMKSAKLKEIACNEFGNFVLQTALTRTKEPESLHLHFRLMKALLPFVKELKRETFGRAVAMKLQNGSKRY